ncbi:MAG: YhjD/YihY/BrkB family envelope integrity protein, partial [Thermaerobacterales bacterium]
MWLSAYWTCGSAASRSGPSRATPYRDPAKPMPHTVGPLQRRQLFSLVWDGLRRISRKYGEDGCAFMAAAIAFYAFFGIFPFILFAVAAAAHVLDPAVLRFELMRAGELYLPGSESLVRTNVDRLVAVRGQMGLVAVLGVFWASSGVFGALRLALNRIWRRRQRPSVIWRKLQDLSITAVLVILLAGSAVSRTVLDAVAGSMDGPIMAWVTGRSALVVPLIAT